MCPDFVFTSVSSLGVGKADRPGPGMPAHFEAVVSKQERTSAEEVRVDSGLLDGASEGAPERDAHLLAGHRTKNTLEGRDPGNHGHPVRIGELLATLDGAAYTPWESSRAEEAEAGVSHASAAALAPLGSPPTGWGSSRATTRSGLRKAKAPTTTTSRAAQPAVTWRRPRWSASAPWRMAPTG